MALQNALSCVATASGLETEAPVSQREALDAWTDHTMGKARERARRYSAQNVLALTQAQGVVDAVALSLETDPTNRMPNGSGWYVSVAVFLTTKAANMQAIRLLRAGGLRSLAAELQRLVEANSAIDFPPC
jgi:hypothetical protein